MMPLDFPEDESLTELVEAAQIVVDNGRWGESCCYDDPRLLPHRIGSDNVCAMCRLYRALEPYCD